LRPPHTTRPLPTATATAIAAVEAAEELAASGADGADT
jgi:hypothetical protein